MEKSTRELSGYYWTIIENIFLKCIVFMQLSKDQILDISFYIWFENNNSENMQSLESTIKQFMEIDEQETAHFMAQWETRKVEKNDILIKAKAINNYIFFVNHGVMAFQNIALKHRKTTWLAFEGEFATDTFSFFGNQKAKHEMKAITDGEVMYISKEKLESLYNENHIWERWSRLLLEKYILNIMERSHLLQFMEVRERYEYITQKRPNIVNEISLGELSAYLNCSQETLSRVRAERF
jgi:CRP/FNR family transcriptional regulator, anaerobic regulatory protein